uniref:Charged multivesicular body protein 2b n=2 Tax=Ascaris TaxID=6251 RepID=A0A0M3HUM6_ASCLU
MIQPFIFSFKLQQSFDLGWKFYLSMSWFKKTDPKEEMRANQRVLRRTNRELESDRRALERKEKELEIEIKKLAKSGQRDACAVLAKELLQLRKQKAKSINMSAKMNAIGAQNRHMYSVGKMAHAVGNTTEAMRIMEKQMPVDKLAKNMRDFTAAQERLGVADEMVSETLDAMLDESGDEEEQNAIVNQVLDEIGIDLNAQLSKAPKAPAELTAVSEPGKQLTDTDLEKMLANLRS